MDIQSIGITGLRTAQIALVATSNNVSNVYTPGYNREVVSFAETGSGGVKVGDVERQFDQFVATQLNGTVSSVNALQAYQTQIAQIDNLLADRDAGLAPLMQNFFSSLQDLAAAPSDPAARQGVLGTANTLTAQLRGFDGYLQDMQEGVNGMVRDEVFQINNLAEQLATLNREIALARARNGEAPNSLLNQRDHMVAQLAERLDLRLEIQDGTTYNVSLANGQPLVAGTRHYGLEAVTSKTDPQRLAVAYRDGGGGLSVLPDDVITGGSLGGVLTFRSETLDRTQNQLGQLAVTLGLAFNKQHAAGVDLNGAAGGDFFTLGAPQAYADARNKGSAEIVGAAYVEDDYTALRATDYTVRVTNAATPDFTVVRRDTGASLDAIEVQYDATGKTLSFGGITLTFDDPALLQTGDRFEIQPVRRGAGNINVAIADIDQIAAGLPDAAGSGDNRNALKLQDLQSASIVGGRASVTQAYAAMVGDVGNRANVVKVNLQAMSGLREQLQGLQQAESGVNLDEEAANLIRYQQYYQANAKVIETGTTVLDIVLGLKA
ncbi:flagellar hook-associated protein FlgK [Thauera chlorobenzoica]|uniref:Flagellar hook-associated protein 1 n=1 Tax=Thauera chlorobenzoica TaxID=96773 RepID=A0A1H5W9Z7_9RHOO|nr:flagellar hook-associated protein FlgK [Thauera chlorobenzoica]APR03238.1 Flagellar hook-associated protein FlgK [Thauera chlorobenzoica]SEF96255.1 flagellar hook-associated protein 1 FlgK [Thauera chlorobenzoica]